MNNDSKTSMPLDFFTVHPACPWPPPDTRRILILDSSFNPPTKAHATLLTSAIACFPAGFFDASLLLFSTCNADKALTGASVDQRMDMMTLLARHLGERDATFHTMAVGQTIHGRFVDKAKCIAPHNEELYFIVGYDTITRLLDPKYYETAPQKALEPFFEQCHLVCADRTGAGEEADMDAFWAGDVSRYRSRITRFQLPASVAPLSSTQARTKVRAGSTDIDTVLDHRIVDYIQHNKLYQLL